MRTARLIAVPALSLLLVTAVGACSRETAHPAVSPTAGGGSVTPHALTAPASTDDLAEAGLLADASIDRAANVEVGVEASVESTVDGYGTYTRVQLSDDAPIFDIDPAGRWAGATDRLDPAYVSETLERGARFFVEDWVDSPARWDDSDDAWAELNTALGTLMQAPGRNLRKELEGDETAGRYLDIDRWRQELGLRPAPYVDGQVRFVVQDLAVTELSVYELEGTDHLGLHVRFLMNFDEPVVNADGEQFVMSQQAELGIDDLDGQVVQVVMNGVVEVGRDVRGGIDAVPVLDVPSPDSGGWQSVQVGRLTLALPPNAVLADPHGDIGMPGWMTYTLGESALAGGQPPRVRVRDAVEGSAEPAWFALDGFTNYRFDIPGATAVMAERGRDWDGRYRVHILVYAEQDGAPVHYRVEFDSTAETAEAELLQYVATMSVAAA